MEDERNFWDWVGERIDTQRSGKRLKKRASAPFVNAHCVPIFHSPSHQLTHLFAFTPSFSLPLPQHLLTLFPPRAESVTASRANLEADWEGLQSRIKTLSEQTSDAFQNQYMTAASTWQGEADTEYSVGTELTPLQSRVASLVVQTEAWKMRGPEFRQQIEDDGLRELESIKARVQVCCAALEVGVGGRGVMCCRGDWRLHVCVCVCVCFSLCVFVDTCRSFRCTPASPPLPPPLPVGAELQRFAPRH